MGYDDTELSLNDAVWDPWSAMPNVDCHLRAVEAGTFMVDFDVGEIFLNFMLEPFLRPHAGVDLSSVFLEGKNGRLKGWWERIIMGFGHSPYLVTKEMLVVEERVRSARLDPENIFRWHDVTLNLPGMDKYEPRKPWVYKVRQDGTMVAGLFFYVYYGRPTAPSTW